MIAFNKVFLSSIKEAPGIAKDRDDLKSFYFIDRLTVFRVAKRHYRNCNQSIFAAFECAISLKKINGKVVGFRGIWQDISARKKTEKAWPIIAAAWKPYSAVSKRA
jgi:hypothetical protein